jgi:hypothetical protein
LKGIAADPGQKIGFIPDNGSLGIEITGIILEQTIYNFLE